MGRRHRTRRESSRRLVAAEAARIMTDQGIRDYYQAKIKAAMRLGIHNDGELPGNAEIEKALRERLSLFSDDHPAQLKRLREAAVGAMKFFADFRPRLVGPVLEGTADDYSAVCLHLFADAPEDVTLFLDERSIPYDLTDRQLRIDRETVGQFPVCVFEAGGVPMDLTILPHKVLRQAPISPVSGKPMKRASLFALNELLERAAEAPA